MNNSKTILVGLSFLFMGILFGATSAADLICKDKQAANQSRIGDFARLKDAILEELRQLQQSQTSGSQSEKAVPNRKFYRVDLASQDMRIFNADGVITGLPLSHKQKASGSGILISPCHVLTNRHVVFGLAELAGKFNEEDVRKLTFYFHAGEPQTCSAEKVFSEQDIRAEILEMGNTGALNDDWAILTLARQVSDDIPVPEFSRTASIPEGYGVVKAGYPGSEMKHHISFSAHRIQHDRVRNNSITGITQLDNTHFNGGLSGGPIRAFKLDTGKVHSKIYAINIVQGEILDTARIYRAMSETTRATIDKASASHSCYRDR